MSQNNFIKTLMNIQEENLQFSNDCIFIKKKDITIKRLHVCPFCNLAHIVRNEWKTSYIRFLKFQQYPIEIALKTLKKYKEFIINTLETTYNNGLIEGTNNLIKCIKRISFGYRCFSNFRKRIMIIKGLIDINNEII